MKKYHCEEYALVRCSSKAKPSISKGQGSQNDQQTLVQWLSKTKKLSSTSKEHKHLTKAVTHFLVKDMLPPYLVDKPGFRKMGSIP